MGFWNSILKIGGQTVKAATPAVKATGKSVGEAIIHPARTLKGAGQAMKTAAIGGSLGYVGWEKLTTDKSVVEIVSDAVVGESVTDTLSETADDIKELKNKAGDAIDTVNDAMGDINSKWSGMSNFFRGLFSGNGIDMFKNFFSNLGKGNVSGLSIAGLIAASFLVFGRFGWLGKIAGTMLGLMMIGNNANMKQVLQSESTPKNEPKETLANEETQSRGMRR